MPDGCQLIHLPAVKDERGGLTFAEGNDAIPFEIKRVFWIYDIPQYARRGGHAHWECSEVVYAVRGAFTMLVDNGCERTEVRLDNPSEGILIPAGVWCELKDFALDTVLVVVASHPYNALGYVHDYSEYINRKRK